MINFSEITFEDFKELVLFLKFNDDENEYHNITKRLTRFIDSLNAYKSILIDNIIKDILSNKEEDAKILLDRFKESFPDTQFDPDGKLDLTNFNYFELSLQSCDLIFNQAKEKINSNQETILDRQVYDAKTLEPLLKLNGRYEYPLRKVLYFRQNTPRSISKEEIKELESKIKELFPEENNILGKFLDFIFYKKYEKCRIFVEHFLYRVDILFKDKKREHPSDKEFYDLLKKL